MNRRRGKNSTKNLKRRIHKLSMAWLAAVHAGDTKAAEDAWNRRDHLHKKLGLDWFDNFEMAPTSGKGPLPYRPIPDIDEESGDMQRRLFLSLRAGTAPPRKVIIYEP